MKTIELTNSEARALRVVADSAGKASWYHIARVVTPIEFPAEDTNPIHILRRLEEYGLIEKAAGGGHLQWYRTTIMSQALLAQ